MTTSNEKILVTGGSGFLGSHVIHLLLESNYDVRATARAAKVSVLQERYAEYGSRVEAVALDDIVSGDYTEALKGVYGVIHLASPGIGKADAKTTIEAAVKGALNIATQAAKGGVKRLVVTSSIVALMHPSEFGKLDAVTRTPDDWSNVTEEEVTENANNAVFAYASSKAFAERALWDFADAHPELDLTTILPPVLLGPFAPEFHVAKDNLGAISTNSWVYQLLTGDPHRAFPPLATIPSLDVRDAARAHVLALRAPQGAHKRLLVSAGAFGWRELVEYVAEVRPALRDRLIDVSGLPEGEKGRSGTVMDTRRAKEVLGIERFAPWKEFVLEAVDDLVKMEKSWSV